MLLAALMSIAMLVTIPQTITQVRADEGDKALVLGTGALSKDANGEKAQILSYGGQDWYVIAYNGLNGYGEYISYINAGGFEEALYRENVVTVLQKSVGKDTAFRKDSDAADANEYGKSDLQAYFKTLLSDETKPILSKQEQSVISARTLAGGTPNLNEEGYDDNKIKGADVTDAKLWPLSVAEASTLPNSIRTVGNEQFWWLRTPGEDDRSTAVVWAGGDINDGGSRVSNPVGVRAAFDLNRNGVLFTSAAEGGKASASEGTDALTPIGTNKNNRWKVTLKDDGTITGLEGHKGFEVTSVTSTCSGNSLDIGYKGAVAGTNEYISAIIVNSDGAVTYYGRLGFASADANASVTINLGSALGEGDKLYLFNEQYNGDNKTDYASALKEVTIPPTGHDWAFTGFTWFEDAEGYTGAEANYECKNEPEHTTSIAAEFYVNEVAPTCTEEGNTSFVASVAADYSLDGQEHSESKKSEPSAPLGHDWAFWDFSWTGDAYSGYTEAIATFVCRHDESHVQAAAATITEETIASTCTDTGRTNYTAVVSAEDSPDGEEHSAKADAKYIDPLGHDWEFTGITWLGDEESGYTGAEANYKCKRDESHTTSVYLDVFIDTKEPTCTEGGGTVFTVAIEAAYSPDGQDHSENKEALTTEPLGHEYQSIVTEPTCTEGGCTTHTCTRCGESFVTDPVEALGHDWNEPTYTWSTDYQTVTAQAVCKRDPAHRRTETAQSSAESGNAGCTEPGTVTFTAAFADPLFQAQEVTVSGVAMGHAVSDWETVRAAGCLEPGLLRGTCTRCGETVEKETPATGHDWAEPTYVWSTDNSTVTASCVCRNDPTHTRSETAQTTARVTKEPTCDEEGELVFTAEFENEDFAAQTMAVAIPKKERPHNPFVDVEEGKYYFDAVLWAVSHEPQITNGMDDTHFVPGNTCTRGQVVTFLWRAAGCPEPENRNNPFVDVTGGYYYKAVLWALENGVTTGMDDTHFEPGGECTRGQVVTFLWRAVGKPGAALTETAFTDVSAAAYYYKAMLWAVENEITKGMTATSFAPDGVCTRGQVVTFLHRTFE